MYDNVYAEMITDQTKESPITNFSSINPRTKLDTLNLNWRERDLPEKLRTKHVHRLHPYLGKFIPQLVEIFLRKFEPKLVYDPFCGSGTALVESSVLGINSIGVDISAFNVLLSKVKTEKYDIDLLEKESIDILSKLLEFKKGVWENKNGVSKTDNRYLKEWFSEQTLKELLYYRSLIKGRKYENLFNVILSRSARSARLVTHFDLDFPKKPQKEAYHCYKHRKTCSPVQEAYKFLTRYTIDTLDRIKEYTLIRKNANAQVIHGDSREIELPNGIDMVFTSPPYVGLIDYHEQHKYAYELLGLKNNETKEIGAAKFGQSEEAKNQYNKGINEVLIHTRKYMKKDGLMIIVVNDKFSFYNPDEIGFKSVGRVERHVNRRTGRRNGAFYESVLIWRKS